MSLAESLLSAITRMDGQALVMHVGERPYVVASAGQVELSSRVLTTDAVLGMLGQLLPVDVLASLSTFGVVEHETSSPVERETFRVVAARGGDDIWLEIRRRVGSEEPEPVREVPEVAAATPEPAAEALDPVTEVPELVAAVPALAAEVPESEAEVAEPAAGAALPRATFTVPVSETPELPPDDEVSAEPRVESVRPPEVSSGLEQDEVYELVIDEASLGGIALPWMASAGGTAPRGEDHRQAAPADEPPAGLSTSAGEAKYPQPVVEAPGAVVVPLSRTIRQETPAPRVAGELALDRLLQIAAARGASALYLASAARPLVRVDGEMTVLERESPLDAVQVERLVLELAPEPTREALRNGIVTEWICDVQEVGRLRCTSFRDHRGSGAIFRMLPARAISAEQLGLSREIRALSELADGLVLVAGPRSSGKSTLVSAFVDLINRTRSDHVITLEGQIKFVHESRRSFVSQREVRGDHEEMLAAARAALREDPDVLIVEDLRSAEIVGLALEAAEAGRLVMGGVTAPGATAAIERLLDQTKPDRRSQVQIALAATLRGVVGQVLIRKAGGGRVAARELLLNTAAVANLIAEAKTFQLPVAIESGRRHGMTPLNDALAGLVQNATVDAREAWRKAFDRDGLVALLRRHGVDTSFTERLA